MSSEWRPQTAALYLEHAMKLEKIYVRLLLLREGSLQAPVFGSEKQDARRRLDQALQQTVDFIDFAWQRHRQLSDDVNR